MDRAIAKGDAFVFPNRSILSTLLENLHEGVYFTDTQRRITYWNRAAEQITGFNEREVLGKCCADNVLMHVDDDGTSLCKGLCPLAASMKDGVQRCAKVFAHHKDGHRVAVKVTTAPIRDEAGVVIGGLETFVDATSELASLREVHEKGRDDLLCPLTGVGTQEYAKDSVGSGLAELGTGEALMTILLGIDDFDHLAERYGKTAGDIVLKMVARTIAGALQSPDFVGRWGADAFLVLIPGEANSQPDRAANRLRVLVERSSRDISKGQLRVTVSGCAACAAATVVSDTVLKRLEAGMHTRKRNEINVIVARE
jgi:diguanylate cyclase (GGDEF)-like protein/PAS domain S-box-containing protein